MKRKNSKRKKSRLCVYLFKEDCSNWNGVLKDSSALNEYSIKGFSREDMLLFVKASKARPPKWTRFFKGVLDRNLEDLLNLSSSAVLLVKNVGRIFAFTFGYGRSLLNLNFSEEAFGLKVALNSIDSEKIMSVDIKNLDTVVRHSKVQTSQAGPVDNFGMNIDRDILNAVTGISNDTTLGKYVSGAISLHLSITVEIASLPDLCSKLLHKFKDTAYKERFPWVDHITDVKNRLLAEELNNLLIRTIQKRELENLFLAVPELIDWEFIQGFKYKPSDEVLREDIHISDFLPENDKELKEKVNMGWLKRQSVLCVGADNDEIIKSWSLYSCINYEIKKGGDTFILTGAKWFKVDTNYVDTVEKQMESIPEYSNFNLPNYEEGENEAPYNERVHRSGGTRCILMDKKYIYYGGGRNKIEFCDLFIDKRDFIHVKRFRSSGALSHLFFQGRNSAFLLMSDTVFLGKVNKHFPSGWKFDETKRIDPFQYEVVFAIISKVKKGIRDVIPFFSKVSLLQVYSELTAYRYNVSIVKINALKK